MTMPGYPQGCPEPSQVHGCAWSGSPNANNADNAWNVNFNNGNDNWNNKNNTNSVRLVRGEWISSSAQARSGDAPPPETPAARIPLRELEHAWRAARRHKRASHNRLAFEVRWLDRLVALREQLNQGSWRPSPAVCFITLRPKAREIHAPDFADRVVHHWLVPRLERLYEPVFIYDSHANRKGHGTHLAVDRLQTFMRRVVDGYRNRDDTGVLVGRMSASVMRRKKQGDGLDDVEATAVCGGLRCANPPYDHDEGDGARCAHGYALQLDIRNFFNRIHRPTLYALLKARLAKAERQKQLTAEARHSLQTLCHALLARHPAERVRYRDEVAARAAVPEHKRLENAPPGCGLPIGNLTSQFFANVYLNELDQFVKHELKCRHYVRYVDDFVLLHPEAAQLRAWLMRIQHFLGERLKLGLKEDIRLRPIQAGVDFLGYIVYPHGRRVRRRVLGHADERLRLALQALPRQRSGEWSLPPQGVARLHSVLASYQGHAGHAGVQQSLGFAQRLLARHAALAQLFFPPLRIGTRVHWRSRFQPHAAETFLQQAQALLTQNPSIHVLIMQRGSMLWVYVREPEHGVPTRERFRVHWNQRKSLCARLRGLEVAFGLAQETRRSKRGTYQRQLTRLFIPKACAQPVPEALMEVTARVDNTSCKAKGA